jgi:hypothetical protein
MEGKRYYKNFGGSVFTTIVLSLNVLLLFICAIGSYMEKEYTDLIGFSILWSIFFVLPMVGILIFGCYEYWYVKNETLYCKKLFRRKKQILFSDIQKAEKTNVRVLLSHLYPSSHYRQPAYVIYGKEETITIILNPKNETYVKDTFEKYSRYTYTLGK